MFFLQNKDLPKDPNDPLQIDPDHVVSDTEMADDAHDGIDTNESEVNADTNDDDDDHDGDHDGEAVGGSSK